MREIAKKLMPQNLWRNGDFYYEKVENATKLAISYEDYAQDISLKGEFIRNVLASDLEEAMKAEVIHCGLRALSGEEVAE